MYPAIQLGGVTISVYALLIVAGIAAGCIAMRPFAASFGIEKEDALYATLFGAIGAALCGKLAYVLVSLPGAKDLSMETLAEFFQHGYVYYGGLAGAVLGVWIYCRAFRLAFLPHLDGTVVALPLIHAFGRVGCFFAGCCYGVRYDGPLAVTFRNSPVAPNGVGLFPVQLLEAALNLGLFACFCAVFRSRDRAGRVSVYGALSLRLCRYTIFCGIPARRYGARTVAWPVHFAMVQRRGACGRALAAAAPKKDRCRSVYAIARAGLLF